jgi:uncharacterized membrane protein YeaQ/YmgE (transglycosylase-associated protein family)
MWIIGTIVVGFVVGAIGRLLLPGKDPGGLAIALLLGMGGSLTAGLLGRLLGWYRAGETAGFIGSMVGAILLLLLHRFLAGRATTRPRAA